MIIPTRNEERTLGPVLDRIHTAAVWEVLVIDGASSDGTCDVARRHGATLVHTSPGRGRQLNAGAAAATGDALLFLHADTLLPLNFEEDVFRILARPEVSAGAFRLCIDAPQRPFRLIEKMVDYRSRFLRMPYGDQAIFLRAGVFNRVGGFPDWPVMEDFALVRQLRRVGDIEIARAAVLTSARRWRRHGVLWTTFCNQACLAAYRLGVSPDRIARLREGRGSRHRTS